MYIIRGEIYLDFGFVNNWEKEFEEMNVGKVGAPFRFPEPFMKWQAVWHQFIDCHGLEGIARSFAKLSMMLEYEDYITAWKRKCDLDSSLISAINSPTVLSHVPALQIVCLYAHVKNRSPFTFSEFPEFRASLLLLLLHFSSIP
jgi:hypothetical protein